MCVCVCVCPRDHECVTFLVLNLYARNCFPEVNKVCEIDCSLRLQCAVKVAQLEQGKLNVFPGHVALTTETAVAKWKYLCAPTFIRSRVFPFPFSLIFFLHSRISLSLCFCLRVLYICFISSLSFIPTIISFL